MAYETQTTCTEAKLTYTCRDDTSKQYQIVVIFIVQRVHIATVFFFMIIEVDYNGFQRILIHRYSNGRFCH